MLASKDDEKSHVASTVGMSLLDSTVAGDSITSIDDTVTASNGAYDNYTDITDIINILPLRFGCCRGCSLRW